MFPRIKRTNRGNRSYEYLVISQSVRDARGRSTTKDLATLGNVAGFGKASVQGLIDGLIRLFHIEEYGLCDQVEILSSLEHGSILVWRALWNRLELGRTVRAAIKREGGRSSIAAEKYVEMMVVNRCVTPLSKLATSRWMQTTSYSQLKSYADLPLDVEYFYRSMDYLLKAKDRIEKAIYERLCNLFSINVRLTFYDITSTFFYGGHCPLAKNGYSRDTRPDKVQVVIGVVTSYEGYPLKHYVFEGNRQDQSTVGEVVAGLRKDYNIEETIFVGDRGMISRLNLDRLEGQGYDYIMGVKSRQEEIMPMVLEDPSLFERGAIEWNGLKIADRHITVSDFLIWKIASILQIDGKQRRSQAWRQVGKMIAAADNETKLGLPDLSEPLAALGVKDRKQRQKISRLLKKHSGRYADTVRLVCAQNPDRKKQTEKKRAEKLKELSSQLDKIFADKHDDLTVRLEKVFDAPRRRYRRFFRWTQDTRDTLPAGYRIDDRAVAEAKLHDGLFVLNTTRHNLSPEQVVASYKNLQEVETLFDDLKHFVDIHPVRRWLERRVRAHVFLCILSLLLKRVLEIDCLGSKAVTETLETVAQSKLVNYRVRLSKRSTRTRSFWKVTTPTPQQLRGFAAVGVNNPQSLAELAW